MNYRLMHTRKYDLFSFVGENRPVDLSKRRSLRESMGKYGFIPAYPLHCKMDDAKRLTIRDGQHRLAVAQELGLPVWYVVCVDDASIPLINSTQKRWSVADYAGSYAKQGNKHYQELLDFHRQHGIALSMAAAILADTGSAGNTQAAFRDGLFVVKSRELADRIARLFVAITATEPACKTYLLVQTLYAICRVEGMDDDRLISNVRRCPELLRKYGSREGYLDMLERVYNYGRHTRYALKIEAENAMRARNASIAKARR
jgi:hypothetical protein